MAREPKITAAGDLRERLAFETETSADDGYGNEISGGWTEMFTVSAKVRPLRGGEDVMTARLQGRQPVIVTVRQSTQTRAVTPAWRARDVRAGTIYNIRSIADPDGRRAFFDLLCETGVPT